MKSFFLSALLVLTLLVSVGYTFNKTIIKQDFLAENLNDGSGDLPE